MKIKINQISPEGMTLEEVSSAKDLDLEASSINFSEPVNIKAQVYRITNAVTINMELKSKIRTVCSRCLTEFNITIDRKLNFSYPIQKRQDYIDPDEDIRQEIILDYPLKPICKSGCKGLCPKCGKNLNQGPCGCQA